jgi:class 3 adenylate cyclase
MMVNFLGDSGACRRTRPVRLWTWRYQFRRRPGVAEPERQSSPGSGVGSHEPLPRGTVTFLLTDIEGSTRHWEASPGAMRAALLRHDALLTRGIAEHSGHVLTERGEGDSFFAVFERASDAVAATSDLQQTLYREAWPVGAHLKVRMAVHTGEAGGDYRGQDVNRCARLRAIAHGGQVLSSSPQRPKPSSDGSFRLERVFKTSGGTVSAI